MRQWVNSLLAALREIVAVGIPAFNDALRTLEAPAIVVKPPKGENGT